MQSPQTWRRSTENARHAMTAGTRRKQISLRPLNDRNGNDEH